jgi:quercetin dioxygenase-like cupin family protein
MNINMNTPLVNIGLVSNVFVRQMNFKNIGDIEYGHTHTFDHLTLLAKGSLSVNVNGNVSTYAAPMMIFIKADVEHELTALENDTVAYCIHALRELDNPDDILDPSMIPLGVNMEQFYKPYTDKILCAKG